VVAARRSGVARASGRYIKFLDADDLMPPNALSALHEYTTRWPDDVFIGRACEVDEVGTLIGSRMYNLGYQPKHLSRVRSEFLFTQPTSSSLWLLPKRMFTEHELFGDDSIRLGEEYSFAMRVVATGRVHQSFRSRGREPLTADERPSSLSETAPLLSLSVQIG